MFRRSRDAGQGVSFQVVNRVLGEIAILIAVAAGCEQPAPAVMTALPVAVPPSTGLAFAPAPVAAASAPAQVVVGYDRVPEETPAEAVRTHREAKRLLDSGDAAGARPGIEEALRLSPGFDAARITLARALARTGDVEGAASGMYALLERDLLRFRGDVERDLALAPLREGSRGTSHRERVSAIETAWTSAVAAGVPVVLWRPDRDEASAGAGRVRPGMYVAGTRRFVALAPPIAHAAGALVDAQKRKTVVVRAAPVVSEASPLTDVQLLVFAMTPSDEPIARVSVPVAWRIEVEATAEGARYRVTDEDSGRQPWRNLVPGGGRPGASQSDPAGASLFFDRSGSRPRAEVPGMRVARNDLVTPAGPVPLGGGHAAGDDHAVHLSPDGSTAVAVSWSADCANAAAEGGILRHVVDRVNLATRAVDRLSAGRGGAAAVFGPDGALYLQIASELRRYPTPGAVAHEPVMEGILLAALPTDVCN